MNLFSNWSRVEKVAGLITGIWFTPVLIDIFDEVFSFTSAHYDDYDFEPSQPKSDSERVQD